LTKSDSRLEARLRELETENLKLRAELDAAHADAVALQRARRLLDLAEGLMQAGIAEYTPADQQITWSQELYRIFEREPQHGPLDFEQLARSILPEDGREPYIDMAQAITKSKAFRQEFSVQLQNGVIKRLNCLGFGERREDGSLSKVFMIVEDVTERYSAERERRFSEDKFTHVFQSSPDGVIVASLPEGIILEVNDTFCEVTGYSREDVIGKTALELNLWVHAEDRDVYLRGLDAGGIDNMPIQFRMRDQRTVNTLMSARVIEIQNERMVVGHIRDITDYAKALAELAASEERFAKAFGESPGAASIHRMADGVVLGVNRRFEAYTGRPEQQVIGKSIHDLGLWVNEDDRTAFMRELASRGHVDGMEADLRRRDESTFPALISATLMEFGGERCAIWFLLDMTAVLQAEHRLALALDANPDSALLERLSDGHLLRVNRGFTEMTGWRRNEVEGRSVLDIGFWDDPERRDEFVEQLREQRQVRSFETHFRRQDGTTFLGRATAGLLDTEEEETAVVNIADITAEEAAKSSLRESELKFATLFRSSPAAISIVRRDDFTLLDANDTWHALFGSPGEPLAGLAENAEFWTDLADYAELHSRIQEHDTVTEFETRLQTKDGRTMPVLMSATRSHIGGVACALLYAIDVSEIKKIEEQLRQSQKMEAIGQLAGGIAHDFNNLLGGISGFAELVLLEQDDMQQVQEYGRQIIKATGRAADLTNQLLLFARRGPLQLRPVELHNVINSAVALLERSLDRRVEIVRLLEAPSGLVLGDEAQLENALINMCINAQDAMPDGGTITIATKLVDVDEAFCTRQNTNIVPGEHLRLSVSDTGVGIPRDLLENIFEPFFTTKGAGRGTGLGLAAVYGTVNSLNGGIEVTSKPGEGAAFHLYLPVCEERRQPGRPRETQLVMGSGIVMVVEDESALRTLLQDMLRRLGYTAVPACDGVEALEIYRERGAEVDLVLLDLNMPRMNGQTAFAELKQINPNVRVLLMSGYTQSTELEQLVRAGAAGHVRKPFDLADLSRQISRALSNTLSLR
jgi:two-component system cell cycle sensor histidine kinase/response regulator CckA